MFYRLYPRENEGKIRGYSYGGVNTYLGMKIEKWRIGFRRRNSLRRQLRGRNQSYRNPKRKGETSKRRPIGGEQTISRSGLGKLMCIARIARPGAIYAASATAQTFSVWRMGIFRKKRRLFRKWEKEDTREEIKYDFEHVPGFSEICMGGRGGNVAKVNLLKKTRNRPIENTFYGIEVVILKKAIRESKGVVRIE